MEEQIDLWKGTWVKKLLIGFLITMLIFLLFPVLYNLVLSLFRKHAYLPDFEFAGLSNYYELLNSKEFTSSFINGCIYAFLSVFFQLVIGVYCALYLNKLTKSRSFLQGIIVFPYLIPTVIVVILWKWLLNSSYGLLNQPFITKTPITWFDESHIMFTMIFISVWQFFPFITIFVLARLRSIPQRLYQSATIDGATEFQKFRHITFPAIRSMLIVLLFIRFIWMFTKFDVVWLLAGKGSTLKYVETLPVLAYRQTFRLFQAGMGATVSVLMLLIIISGTFFWIRHMIKEKQMAI